MKIIKASAEILMATPNLEQVIELAGRVCYKSEDRITEDSAAAFIQRMHDSKHESVLEHGAITVRVINDRGISHEEVRHRICSFSQESTRYVNYTKGKFGSEITVIDLIGGFPDMGDIRYAIWKKAMEQAERSYFEMIEAGATPQEARSVLPNSLKTELVWTANPREWRWIFTKRCHKTAHPQIREIMRPLMKEFAVRWPSLFSDLLTLEGNYDE